MAHITIDVQGDLANKFNNLMLLFDNKEQLVEKFIDYHVKKFKREISRIQTDLDEYEKKYNMSSTDFYEQFEAGKLGDDMDFIIWSGIYGLQLERKQKLQELL
ncbi:MAG: hypothetical protein F6K17_40195 [Okeania sp. SIO3C4]|nr:hypothetical protein [Okeania sp. SIO3C4]